MTNLTAPTNRPLYARVGDLIWNLQWYGTLTDAEDAPPARGVAGGDDLRAVDSLPPAVRDLHGFPPEVEMP